MEDKKIAKMDNNSPAEMIKMAISGGADLDKLEKFLILQERWDAGEARKSYVKAMTAFKSEAPIITKDKKNNQYNSKYTSLNNLVNTVNPILSKHGLSANWNVEQNGLIKVSCRITHEKGHSETSFASAPADISGVKNAIQQIKSTITYSKSVTFESICGLASTNANLDDDGNASSKPVEKISDKELSSLRDNMADLNINEVKLSEYLKVESLETMTKDDYNKALVAIKKKREAKK